MITIFYISSILNDVIEHSFVNLSKHAHPNVLRSIYVAFLCWFKRSFSLVFQPCNIHAKFPIHCNDFKFESAEERFAIHLPSLRFRVNSNTQIKCASKGIIKYIYIKDAVLFLGGLLYVDDVALLSDKIKSYKIFWSNTKAAGCLMPC